MGTPGLGVQGAGYPDAGTSLRIALAAADAGADGVIVGSRLVRAAAESADPATAVRELVSSLSAGLAL